MMVMVKQIGSRTFTKPTVFTSSAAESMKPCRPCSSRPMARSSKAARSEKKDTFALDPTCREIASLK